MPDLPGGLGNSAVLQPCWPMAFTPCEVRRPSPKPGLPLWGTDSPSQGTTKVYKIFLKQQQAHNISFATFKNITPDSQLCQRYTRLS